MNQAQANKYIASRGVRCPYCESDQIEGTHGPDIDGGSAIQEIKCLNCNKYWEDVYKLHAVYDHDTNEHIFPEPKTHFYLIIVWDDVDPECCGPFETEDERDNEAKKMKDLAGDESGVYSMDIPVDHNGVPKDVVVRSYSAAFFSGTEDEEEG